MLVWAPPEKLMSVQSLLGSKEVYQLRKGQEYTKHYCSMKECGVFKGNDIV